MSNSTMRRILAILGSAIFLVIAPGIVGATCLGGLSDGMLERRCWELPDLGSLECYCSSQESPSFWTPSLASRCKVSARLRRSFQHAIWSSADSFSMCEILWQSCCKFSVRGCFSATSAFLNTVLQLVSSFSSTNNLSCGKVTGASTKTSARTFRDGFRVCDRGGASENSARQRKNCVNLASRSRATRTMSNYFSLADQP